MSDKKKEASTAAPKKEEAKTAPKKEETNAEKRAREEKEALKKERKEHKHEAHQHAHDVHAGNIMEDLSKKQVFKKFSYRGLDIGKLLNMNMDEISQQLRARQRRRLRRKMPQRYGKFVKKLLDAKKNCNAGEKPKTIKTHLRDCIVLPSMVQSVISIYNGKGFNQIEVKPEMIGYYLGEFSMTYRRTMHGRPGVGATHSSKFVPIK